MLRKKTNFAFRIHNQNYLIRNKYSTWQHNWRECCTFIAEVETSSLQLINKFKKLIMLSYLMPLRHSFTVMCCTFKSSNSNSNNQGSVTNIIPLKTLSIAIKTCINREFIHGISPRAQKPIIVTHLAWGRPYMTSRSQRGRGVPGFCYNSTQALVMTSVKMGEKGVNNCVIYGQP